MRHEYQFREVKLAGRVFAVIEDAHGQSEIDVVELNSDSTWSTCEHSLYTMDIPEFYKDVSELLGCDQRIN